MIEAIPIVNSLTGEQTGSITVTDDGKAIISGKVPWSQGVMEELVWIPEPTPMVVDLPEPRIVSEGMQPEYVPEPPDPGLVERIKESFPSAYERLLAEGERHVAAAARGLAVHERALRIAEERSLPYEHAIQIAAEEAGA